MDTESRTPFKCHVFVCVNDRNGTRQSCADDKGQEIKDQLKIRFKQQNYASGTVRLTQSGCLGICECGPNVMIYPQEILFAKVTLDDLDTIVDKVNELVK